MDDRTLDSLKTALAVSPDNTNLRLLIIKEMLEKNDQQAAEYAECLSRADTNDEESQMLCARALQLGGKIEQALLFCPSSDQGDLLRVQLLIDSNAHEEAKKLYNILVQRNASLESESLNQLLNGAIGELPFQPPQRPRLRVVSNDDTDQTEINRFIAPPSKTVSFSDVGGLDDVKKQIHKKIILPFQKPSLFQRFRKRVGGGILLYGPPGCGKTLMARATAGECKAKFINVEIADVLDMYIGESERKLHALFELARNNAPSVLFFDEVEALGSKRQHTRESTSSKLISQFLSELDGFAQNNQGVLILASTNVPWALDSAFLRPGRFDRMVFVSPPDREAREAILKLHMQDRPVAGPLDLAFVAKNSSGFSGADLKNLIETAVDEAIEESIQAGHEVPISNEHLQQALREVRPTTSDWLSTARNYARYSNESGQYNDVLDFLKRHGK